MYPYKILLLHYKKFKYLKSGEGERLKVFKDIHLGKRCFIIGNGPSLNISDLEKLKSEKTFAANYIESLFERTSWRPVYYTCVDIDVFNDLKNMIPFKGVLGCFIQYSCAKKCNRGIANNVYSLNLLEYYTVHKKNALDLNQIIYSDISSCISPVRTVTFVNIQLAIYMGFKEIYLLGVDHNYKKDCRNHAEGMKENGKEYDYLKWNKCSTQDYLIAKKHCDLHDIKIYNATRGGELDVFDRIKFDDIINDTTNKSLL
jgi:hypothetical protein